MGRIRTIKPEFWQSETLATVPEGALLLAVALLNHADDEGYFAANPGLVKAACFPLRDLSVSPHGGLSELSRIGYVEVRETPAGRRIGKIVNFAAHQRINRPTASRLRADFESAAPSLESVHGVLSESSVSPHGVLSEPSQGKGTGNRERKGTPCSPPRRKPAADTDADWDRFCAAYPKRSGDLAKAAGRKKFGVLVREGEDPDRIVEGAARYAAWCRATGKAGTEYVQQTTRFLNGRAWEEDFDLPDPGPAAHGRRPTMTEAMAAAERILGGGP